MSADNQSLENSLPLLQRLWIYQRERIPLFKTIVLLSVFSASSINVSAMLAGRDFPAWPAYAAALIVSLVIFIQLRACDEYKDGPADRRYRPERPIPRKLVKLQTILAIAAGLAPVAICATWFYHPPLLVLLGLVWFWMALMAVEFFAADWLKERSVIYLVSHMAIMPLLDLFVTGAEWLPAAGAPARGLTLFLLLSFVNGCILEIGRKTWATENEREGVESYSSLWGVRNAALVWIVMTGTAFALLVGVGVATGHALATIIPGLLMLIAAWGAGFHMINKPSIKAQARLDLVSGLWVFVCYFAAGVAPVIERVFV